MGWRKKGGEGCARSPRPGRGANWEVKGESPILTDFSTSSFVFLPCMCFGGPQSVKHRIYFVVHDFRGPENGSRSPTNNRPFWDIGLVIR